MTKSEKITAIGYGDDSNYELIKEIEVSIQNLKNKKKVLKNKFLEKYKQEIYEGNYVFLQNSLEQGMLKKYSLSSNWGYDAKRKMFGYYENYKPIFICSLKEMDFVRG